MKGIGSHFVLCVVKNNKESSAVNEINSAVLFLIILLCDWHYVRRGGVGLDAHLLFQQLIKKLKIFIRTILLVDFINNLAMLRNAMYLYSGEDLRSPTPPPTWKSTSTTLGAHLLFIIRSL